MLELFDGGMLLGYIDMEILIQWGLRVCISLTSTKSQASNIGKSVA
jgi:hypothetical protein